MVMFVLPGFGTKQNDEEALKWWTLSAQAGTSPSSVRSMNTLALFYSRPERTFKEKVLETHYTSTCMTAVLEIMSQQLDIFRTFCLDKIACVWMNYLISYENTTK